MIKLNKTIVLISIGLVPLMCLSGCRGKDESPHMEVNVLQGEDGITYTRKNGAEQESFQVKKDESYDIMITVQKEEGKLNLSIAKDGEKEERIYEGNDIPSSCFTVHVEEAGDYIIMIDAYDFVGNYTCEITKVQ